MKKLLFLAVIPGVFLLLAGGYKVSGRMPVSGTERWDYLAIDTAARRVYVSHTKRVEVVDADSGKQVGVIPDTPGVHGIAIAPELHRGFTSNGLESKVSIFDTASLKVVEKVAVGKGPYGIYYDAGSKRVFTCNHGSNDITAIDGLSGKVVGSVAVRGAGEQMVTGRNGLVYVAMGNSNVVLAFDPVSLQVRHRFGVAMGAIATALAYDAKFDRLFIGCRSKSMVVMDASNGRAISNLPIGTGVEWAEFDAESRVVFLSAGDGVLSVFRQVSADLYEDGGAVTTQVGAKTMVFDSKTRQVLLPSAEEELVDMGEGKKPVRRIKPGSFGLIVVGK